MQNKSHDGPATRDRQTASNQELLLIQWALNQQKTVYQKKKSTRKLIIPLHQACLDKSHRAASRRDLQSNLKCYKVTRQPIKETRKLNASK